MVQKMLKYRYLSLKNLNTSWRSLEMSLIKCEINLDLNWFKRYIIKATIEINQGETCSITDAKLYVPVVTLSTQVMPNCLNI